MAADTIILTPFMSGNNWVQFKYFPELRHLKFINTKVFFGIRDATIKFSTSGNDQQPQEISFKLFNNRVKLRYFPVLCYKTCIKIKVSLGPRHATIKF